MMKSISSSLGNSKLAWDLRHTAAHLQSSRQMSSSRSSCRRTKAAGQLSEL